MQKLVNMFIDKCLSVLRLGKNWFSKLLGSIIEAARTHSYVETVNPIQSDTFHKEIKQSDMQLLKHEFERSIRIALKFLRFNNVKVAIDVTEEPYWGKKGSYNTRTRVHELSEESWQYVNLSIVEPYFVPLMSLPYRQVDNLDYIVIDLLEYLRTLPLKVNLVLFDRGFYHAHLIDYLESKNTGKSWPYLIFVPKNDAVKEYLKQTGKLGVFTHKMNYLCEKSTWRPITKIVICKDVGKNRDGNPIDWCFATNQKASSSLVWIYRKRWNIETGFRIHDEATIKSKSSNLLVRYFYHLVGMLLILMWRMHNAFENYFVFKRYLKYVEMFFTDFVVVKPP